MEKVAVVGLGIIGGSICAALTSAGYEVHGADLDAFAQAIALEKGYICSVAEDLWRYDTVILAIPPEATKKMLQEARFKDGAIVGDICGVKGSVEKAVYEKPRAYKYVGMHPMAGSIKFSPYKFVQLRVVQRTARILPDISRQTLISVISNSMLRSEMISPAAGMIFSGNSR